MSGQAQGDNLPEQAEIRPVFGEGRYSPVQVQCYAGGRAEEKPIHYTLDGITRMVHRVMYTWLQEDEQAQTRLRCFVIEDSDNRRVALMQQERTGQWYFAKVAS